MEWGLRPVGVDGAVRTLVCGTELTSSDSPQRLNTAHSCLSCQDECQELEGRSLGKLPVPPFSSLAYLSRPRACPVYQGPVFCSQTTDL